MVSVGASFKMRPYTGMARTLLLKEPKDTGSRLSLVADETEAEAGAKAGIMKVALPEKAFGRRRQYRATQPTGNGPLGEITSGDKEPRRSLLALLARFPFRAMEPGTCSIKRF